MVKNLALGRLYNYRIARIVGSALAGVIVILFGYYWYTHSSLATTVGKRLNVLAAEREQEILHLVDQYKSYSATLARDATFTGYVAAVHKEFAAGQLADYKNTPAAYKEAEKDLDHFINRYQKSENYKDLFLINTDGTIFYVYKGEMLNANILSPQYSGGALAHSFERVKMTLTVDISEFTVDPLLKAPAIFILYPVIAHNEFLAVVALRLDETNFYKILQDYTQLGQTGDVLLTKSIGERVLFLAPSRSNSSMAFKKISNPDKTMDTPDLKASLGYSGYGFSRDVLNNPVIAAWRFIPQVNWGLVVKMNYDEAAGWSNYIGYAILVLLLFFLLNGFYILYQLRHSRFIKRIFSPHAVTGYIWTGCITGFVATGLLILIHHNTYQRIFKGTKALAQLKVQSQAEFINQSLLEVEKTTQMIAKDLQTSALKREDIPIRIVREMKAIPTIASLTIAYAPFAFDATKRLHALEAMRGEGDTIETHELTTDYMIPEVEDDPQHNWYHRAVKEGAFWSEPYSTPSKNKEVRYAVPFYTDDTGSEVAGVVVIALGIDSLIHGVRSLEIGKSGYGILMSATETLIYHPLQSYVKNKTTLFDIAREENNISLQKLAQQMQKEKNGFGSYVEPHLGGQYWAIYAAIPVTGWIIAGIFSTESLALPLDTMHKQLIWIFITSLITLLFVAMLISHMEQEHFDNVRRWVVISCCIFIAMMLCFWGIIWKAPYQVNQSTVLIRNQASSDQFIEAIDLDASQRNEKRPISIPTGLILYALTFPDSNTVAISGYAWQKIPKESGIKQGIRFPEAEEATFKEVVSKDEGDAMLVGWNITARFLQKHRFSWFPFDKTHVDIILASADFENNVILAPDFDRYQSLEIDPIPGISSKIVVPGFSFERSFFSFSAIEPYDDVGLETLKNVTENVRLHYNIILQRKLTNPFILFFFPLLIILFSIYAVFLVAFKGNPAPYIFRSLTAYTALFFSLILLHQTLRNQYQAGEFLYIEYFFFFTYITILLLILHALLLRVSHFTKFITRTITPYLRIFFWPLQFAVWFIVTMTTFYILR